jgi:hypothetical protein
MNLMWNQIARFKPKRCASDRKNNGIESVEIITEKSKLLPEFGVKYDHMFAFGNRPQQFSLMGMVIPMPWSTKMNKATINSIKIKNESLEWQKQMRMRHRV